MVGRCQILSYRSARVLSKIRPIEACINVSRTVRPLRGFGRISARNAKCNLVVSTFRSDANAAKRLNRHNRWAENGLIVLREMSHKAASMLFQLRKRN
jgi:hypothetical protein